jgi:hypothetical protein
MTSHCAPHHPEGPVGRRANSDETRWGHQKSRASSLLDHLVGALEQRGRDRQAGPVVVVLLVLLLRSEKTNALSN